MSKTYALSATDPTHLLPEQTCLAKLVAAEPRASSYSGRRFLLCRFELQHGENAGEIVSTGLSVEGIARELNGHKLGFELHEWPSRLGTLHVVRIKHREVADETLMPVDLIAWDQEKYGAFKAGDIVKVATTRHGHVVGRVSQKTPAKGHFLWVEFPDGLYTSHQSVRDDKLSPATAYDLTAFRIRTLAMGGFPAC